MNQKQGGGRRSRAENRANMTNGIIEVGRKQLAKRGATGLSLREVAREIGVAPSALYRYVNDRNALLSLLIADAFTRLSDEVDAAVRAEKGLAEKLTAYAMTSRQWALSNSELWGLIYGNPVPGYEAAELGELDPGVRPLRTLAAIISEGVEDPVPEPPENFRKYLAVSVEELGISMTWPQLAYAGQCWSCLNGVISTEVFGRFGRDFSEVGRDMLVQTVAGMVQTIKWGPSATR
ncbi:TetR/AcrR family transcriptional regulator [Corynebacterium doosanense]|uniref:TetR family transcriptional regulator n=1 Tax=Corynebacterium doosanense CAU 212 = DSM 45436 TaxID=558173 RepID=A0A097ID84_9CORY|nr:TetR/AcrR family transcriptional regulator [Corynebacterium doosanense]AIT60085.1 TetR family transcriptional regulator [Corynebacterium doosanense CAU 212 = DSM 45436]